MLVLAVSLEGLLTTRLVGQTPDLELTAVAGEVELVALDLNLRQGGGQGCAQGD